MQDGTQLLDWRRGRRQDFGLCLRGDATVFALGGGGGDVPILPFEGNRLFLGFGLGLDLGISLGLGFLFLRCHSRYLFVKE